MLGFLFKDGYVALIQKNRPDWQKGKLNGIGGHIEEGETPDQAMEREFYEETGALVSWQFYCAMEFPEAIVYCYKSFPSSGVFLRKTTDEIPDWYNYNALPENVISNLNWLIPLALQKEEYMTHIHLSATLATAMPTKRVELPENPQLDHNRMYFAVEAYKAEIAKQGELFRRVK